jgi:hypothetical protein
MELREALRRHKTPYPDSRAKLTVFEGPDLRKTCAEETYKILGDPVAFKLFELIDGLLCYTPEVEIRLLCIPQANYILQKMLEILMDQAHQAMGHYGSLGT